MLKLHVKVTEMTTKSVTVQDDFLDKFTVLLELVTGKPLIGSAAVLLKTFESYRVFVPA
jgi:hypothetical protein